MLEIAFPEICQLVVKLKPRNILNNKKYQMNYKKYYDCTPFFNLHLSLYI